MLHALQLSRRFDAAALRADLERLAQPGWVTHFNTGVHDGGWSGLALRSPQGALDAISAPPQQGQPYADTPLMAACPAIAAAVRTFDAPVGSVRLLRLAAGAEIRAHRDHDLAFEQRREIRLHVPVVTHVDVDFVLAGRRLHLGEGECWYLNVNLVHRVHNRSDVERIHLVLDVGVNDWVVDLIGRPDHPVRIDGPDPDQRMADPLLVAAELRRLGTETALALAERLERGDDDETAG